VVFEHVRGLFFAQISSLPNAHNPALLLIYFLTGLGRQAVIVFFVLSGFFIGWAVIGATRSGRWSWRGYLVRRLTRLGIVLLPALLLTACWDSAGILVFGAHSAYLGGRAGDFVLQFRVVDHLTLQAFLGNLFFLQGIGGIPTFGSNAPLWSLSYEFWYYMLFPVVVSAYLARGRARWALAAVGALIVAFIGQTIFTYYLIWLLGVALVVGALRLGPRRQSLTPSALIPAGLLFALGLVVGQRHLLPITAADGFLGIACAIFLAAILMQRGTAQWNSRFGRFYGQVARRLASCSYTLYLVHLPFLVFLRAAFSSTVPWRPDAPHLGLGLVIGLAVLSYALVVASLTEARTEQLRHWVGSRTVAWRLQALKI
jgi:peptidoglycan/LPS O-acetylase OafA/YrhL